MKNWEGKFTSEEKSRAEQYARRSLGVLFLDSNTSPKPSRKLRHSLTQRTKESFLRMGLVYLPPTSELLGMGTVNFPASAGAKSSTVGTPIPRPHLVGSARRHRERVLRKEHDSRKSGRGKKEAAMRPN